MNGDSIGAIVFAAAAGLFVWHRLGSDLQQSGLRPIWRHLIIGSGLAVITVCLLYYLGWTP